LSAFPGQSIDAAGRDRVGAAAEAYGGAWCRRHLGLAGSFAIVLGAGGQLLVTLFARPDGTLATRLAAVGYSTAAWLVLGLFLATFTAPWLSHRLGRTVALAVSCGTVATLAFLEAASIAMRVLSGTYLTRGAVMFSVNSSDHFLHAAAGDYRGWVLAMGTVLLSFATLAWRALQPALRATQRRGPPPRLLGMGLVLVAVLLGLYMRRGDNAFTRRMFAGGPLVALVSSLDSRTVHEIDESRALTELSAPLVLPGPPLAAGDDWRREVRQASGPRPNVLLVVLESIAPSHLGFRGYHRDTTPTLDRLASAGLDMTHAWSTATHSNYAQPAILSSLFPRRLDSLDQYGRLDYPRVLFHDVLHLLGYDTATISSQDESWQGMRRFQRTSTPTFFWHAHDYPGPHLDTGTEQIVPDQRTVDVIVDWLAKDRKGPWSLYVNFQATHFPYLIPEDAERRWQPSEPTRATFTYLRYPESERDVVINRYDNALRYVDDALGRLVDRFERQGILDDTLIIVTADHGETFFDKGLVTHGKTLFEVEARVPLLVHWPGRVVPEKRREPVSHLDIMPTLLELLELPPHPAFQGRSFRQPDAKSAGRDALYLNIQGLRFADAIVCWPYKLILERTSGDDLLFNLADDPDEENDLRDAEPAIAKPLAETLNQQLVAQLDYHAEESVARGERYQPRLHPCPELPR
jgi:arylsulfatase A-like enzyme